MGVLRRRYGKGTRIEMTIWPRLGSDGGYSIRNVYGPIWSGRACCRWRARARAAEALAARGRAAARVAGCDGE